MGEICDRVDEVLAVVEKQEERLFPHIVGDGGERRLTRRVGDRERARDLGRDKRRVGDRREFDQPDPVVESIDGGMTGAQYQARLAGSSDPDQGDQSVRAQEAARLFELRLAPDEGGELGRQVRPRRGRPQPRKVALEAGGRQLIDPFRVLDVPQPVFAPREQLDPCGQGVLDQGRGGTRKEHLAAMPECQQPRRAVEGRTIPVTGTHLGHARMDGHPDTQRTRGRPLLGREVALSIDRGFDGRHGPIEDREHAIARRLHDCSTGVLDRGREDRVVCGEGHAHGVAMRLPQAGAPLDGGEQEGRRARGCARVHRRSIWPGVRRLWPSDAGISTGL
jgi:hypothetical protein